MRRSRKSSIKNTSVIKSIKKTLPIVDKSLTTVGSTAKTVAKESIPIIEKGVSAVYGTMSTGLDLGVKGVESVAKTVSKRGRSRKSRHSGGRRTRRRHRRRH